MLELVNAASLVVLDDDVRLDRRAANNIVDHRQPDVIDSIAELDAISYPIKDNCDQEAAAPMTYRSTAPASTWTGSPATAAAT